MNTLQNIAFLVIIIGLLAAMITAFFTAPFQSIGILILINTAAVVRLALK